MMRDRGALLEAIAEVGRLPRTPEHRMVLAEAEFRLAIAPDTDPAEAVDRLHRAIELDPFAAKLHLHLGRRLHLDGRPRAAVRAYQEAVRLAPRSRRAHLMLALALLMLGPPEKQLGQRLLSALCADDAEARASVLAQLHADGAEAKPARKVSGVAGIAVDIWRPALVEQLSRSRPEPRQVSSLLAVARNRLDADGVAPFAVACLLMLVAGEAVTAVRQQMSEAGLEHRPADAALAMLRTAVELAETDDPDAFDAVLTRAVQEGILPVELGCWLLFRAFTRDRPSGIAGIRRLDRFPRSIRETGAFRELRIAIFDDQARQAWAEQDFDIARVLWRQTVAADAGRVPVAVNLALVAARTQSPAEYTPAWERLAELLYLRSVGFEDVGELLDERIQLHLALSQQSLNRYRTGRGARDHPDTAQLAAWVKDRAALEVWLAEWDLYYLNARLRFTSPAHVLAVPRDATPEALTEAHDRLVHQLRHSLGTRRWAGIRVFQDLAEAAFARALREAQSGRGIDPQYDTEKRDADRLLDELVQRALLLRRLSRHLADLRSSAVLDLGALVAAHQLTLPLATIQRACVESGLIAADEVLADQFGIDLTAVATSWNRPEPRSPGEFADRLAGLDRCVAAAPDLIALRVLRCRLLVRADRRADAYAAAVEALSDDPAAAELVAVINDIGQQELPPMTGLTVAKALSLTGDIRSVVARYPHSDQVRIILARLLARLGDAAAARELLGEGIRLACTRLQRQRLEAMLAAVERR
jgi:tetratricopeptide (TPR) repeat protein